MQCSAKTQTGEPCKNKAVKDGFCKVHHPDEIAKKLKRQESLAGQKRAFQEVLDVIEDTCNVKGWRYYLDSYDSKYYKYATVIVKKDVSKTSYTSDEIVGQFNITVDDGVKVSYTNTSFHSYGLRDLQSSIMAELGRLPWLESNKKKSGPDPDKERIYNLISRFHLVSTQLRRRYSSRPTIKIDDEYDVQDLFHALLKIYFDDVRPEEYSPSRGGASSRLDFLLKKEQIVVEVKMASEKLTDKKIGEQLIIDIERYREHPDCNVLICFVYDPEMQIRNPIGLEKDLSRKEGDLEVRVLVVPK